MSTQNQRPESEHDLTEFFTSNTSERRIRWTFLTDAVQPLVDSTADYDREYTSTHDEDGESESTDSYEKCPLCVHDIDVKLNKHLPNCPMREEVPR